jgi:hypothetical protein
MLESNKENGDTEDSQDNGEKTSFDLPPTRNYQLKRHAFMLSGRLMLN